MLNAVDLCYRTSFEQKRWRYAEALRDGIVDPTKINNAIVDFQVLRDVEVPHIQVLDKLASIDLRLQALPPDELRVAHTEGLVEYQNAWNEFPAPITAVLANAGLAKELPTIVTTPLMQDAAVHACHAVRPQAAERLSSTRYEILAGESTGPGILYLIKHGWYMIICVSHEVRQVQAGSSLPSPAWKDSGARHQRRMAQRRGS